MHAFLYGFASGLAVALAVFVWRKAIELELRSELTRLREKIDGIL